MLNLKFAENIEKYHMLKENDKVVACVSGGADSVFLLYNLYALKEKYRLDITVAHVNHGVRESAARDEKFVENLAAEMKLKYEAAHIKMNEYAKENGLSSEEAGRLLRYDFFRSLKGKEGKIFLAHNANDQAETVLFRVIRGTGIKGLAAMDFVDGDLYRPMLNIKRDEIEAYISENSIDFVQDETNFSDIYARNKIRLKIIPYIEENFNENFIDSLIRLSTISRENYNYIEKNAYSLYEKSCSSGRVSTDILKNCDDYILSEVIRIYLEKELGSLEGISRANIKDIEELVKSSGNGRVTLPGNISAVKVYGSMYILNEEGGFPDTEYELGYGLNRTEFGNIRVEKSLKMAKGKNTVSIDAKKVCGKLKIRNRRKGDRFTPFGMKKEKKLKDFFIDLKIDRYLRDKVGIITDDREIIWVMPYRLSNNYAVSDKTEEFINI